MLILDILTCVTTTNVPGPLRRHHLPVLTVLVMYVVLLNTKINIPVTTPLYPLKYRENVESSITTIMYRELTKILKERYK